MIEEFKLPIGFSDHSGGTLAPALAVALGAVMIEKHFTYDPAADGPDHMLSLGPEDFADMVANISRAETMLGSGRKIPAETEKTERTVGRRGYIPQKRCQGGRQNKTLRTGSPQAMVRNRSRQAKEDTRGKIHP